MKLRAIEKSDLEYIRKWRNGNREILRTPYFLTEEMQERFYSDVVSNRLSNARFYAISNELPYAEKHSDLVGYCALNPIIWESSIGEIALEISPEFRKQGIGKEAVGLLLNEGFNVLGLKTIYGECYMGEAKNFWLKIIDKYNFTTARLPNRKYYDGRYYDSIYFSLDKGNF